MTIDTTAVVEQLLKRGLELYGAGQAKQALVQWRRALEIDPESRPAQQYLAHLADLEKVLGAVDAGPEDIPFSLENEDFYEEMTVTGELDAKLVAAGDDGWLLEDAAEGPSPSKPAAPKPESKPELATLVGQGDDLLLVLGDESASDAKPGMESLPDDIELPPAEPSAPAVESDWSSLDVGDMELESEEELTIRRPAAGRTIMGGIDLGLSPEPSAPEHSAKGLDDGELHIDIGAEIGLDLGLDAEPEKATEPASASNKTMMGGLDVGLSPDLGVAKAIAAAEPVMPEPEPANRFDQLAGKVRSRVSGGDVLETVRNYVTLAQDESRRNNSEIAMVAAELAIREGDENAAAQKHLFEHAEGLSEMFSEYLGDLNRVPELAVSLSELAGLGLDNRAGFLVSRVDGLFTTEELLSVSAMPEQEAMRILCYLVACEIVSF